MLAGLQARMKALSAGSGGVNGSGAGSGRGSGGVSWVRPGNIHLTLKFLGAVEAQKTARVVGEIKAASEGFAPVTVSVGGVGGFPSLRNPRVVWVGVKEDPDLLRLQKEIDERLGEAGFEKDERAFHPHLTLCRARTVEGGRTLGSAVMSLKEGVSMDFAADAVVLYKSVLDPAGARYSVVERIPLSGEPR